jgi:hypothetical protein
MLFQANVGWQKESGRHGHISTKRDGCSRRASGRSIRDVPEGLVITGGDSSMHVTVLYCQFLTKTFKR